MKASNSTSSEPRFNLASVKLCTEAMGPHRRMVLWFQGCTFGCPGCYNPELQPLEARHIVGMSDIVAMARGSIERFDIEGVTFIGGEPTLQQGLGTLALSLRDLGLGIILFTGHTCEELDDDLISSVDLIIDGRFEMDNLDVVRNIIGSTNQRIIEVTQRYHKDLGWFTIPRPDSVEMDVCGDTIITNGRSL